MKIHELTVKSHTSPKRVGRGIGSGYGKTSGRGTKGQKARTGKKLRIGFEGGQMPLAQRLPKNRGFKPQNQRTFQVVNIKDLAAFKAGSTVDAGSLAAAGLIRDALSPVKLLSSGELTVKLHVTLDAASASAQAKLEAAGGQFKTTGQTGKRE